MGPGIDTSKEYENSLIKRLKKEEVIFFIGSAVHAPPPKDSKYKYPEDQRPDLAGRLTKALKNDCEYEVNIPDGDKWDLQRISLYYELFKSRQELVDLLEERTSTNKKPSPALNMIASMPVKIFVTTNYDQLLEKALEDQGKTPNIFIYNPNQDIKLGTPNYTGKLSTDSPLVFKMHGDINKRDSIVITDEDYIGFVQRMTQSSKNHPVPRKILFHMTKWPTFFIGYSLLDYNLRLLFRTLRWRIDKANIPKSFSVDIDPDPLILEVYEKQRRFISFLTQNIWSFIPKLYQEIHGKEFEG